MRMRKYRKDRQLNTDAPEISANMYNLLIGAVLLSGFALNALMAYFLTDQIAAIGLWKLVAISFACMLICLIIESHANNTIIKYIAFLGVSAGLGLLLVAVSAEYDHRTIGTAFVMTCMITAVMLLVSSIFPDFFLSLGRVLFLTFIAVIVIELFFSMCLGVRMGIIDYVIILLFSGYVGYDWARAQNNAKTARNAVDSACDLYVDIVYILESALEIADDIV